jgi:hypothetical protein
VIVHHGRPAGIPNWCHSRAAADVVVGVLEEPGVDLHLPGGHGLEVVGQVVPRGDLLVPSGQLGVGGDEAQLVLAGECLLPGVGGVGGAEREVAKSGRSPHQ